MMEMEDEAATSSVESAITVLPVAGSWDYGETTPVSGTCNASFQHFQDGAFRIDNVTVSTFRIVPNDRTAPFTCTSTDTEGFRCPNRASGILDLRPFVDLRLTLQASAVGQFVHSRSAIGKQNLVITCTGSKCGLVGPNPCGYVVNFEVHHTAP